MEGNFSWEKKCNDGIVETPTDIVKNHLTKM